MNLDDDSLEQRLSRSCDVAYIQSLVAKGRIMQRTADSLCSLWEFLNKKSTVPWDMQLRWGVKHQVHRNQYGGNAGAAVEFVVPIGLKFLRADIIFLYSEFEITNSSKHTHTIKDLYVTLPVDVNVFTGGVHFGALKGRRGRATFAEFKRGYRHSHLSSRPVGGSGDYMDNSEFCLGEGELVNTKSLLNAHMDEDLLELFLQQLEVYVKWESLEGVPYFAMNNLLEADYNVRSLDDPMAYLILESGIVRSKRANFDYLNWKFNKVTGKYEIQGTEGIEELLSDLMVRDIIVKDYFFFKDAADNLFSEDMMTDEALTDKILKLPTFHFKGQQIKLHVEGKPRRAENRKLYPHQKLVQYAKQLLEYKANSENIRESRIKEFS